MEKHINIHSLSFRPYLSAEQIASRVNELGRQISQDYANKNPIFLAVLNGAFIFAADLLRACSIDCSISFIRLSSYEGLSSSGQVKTIIGLQEELKGRHVIVVEDIVDTGHTMAQFVPQLQRMNPASVAIASLLVKPDALEKDVEVRYTGFEIPNRFVLGYGLDYDGLGRNIPGLYQLVEG